MEEIQWSFDSYDWYDGFRDAPDQIVRRLSGPDVVSGSVLQFHLDGHHTAEILDQLIPHYQNDFGYRVVTAGELMRLSDRELPALPDF